DWAEDGTAAVGRHLLLPRSLRPRPQWSGHYLQVSSQTTPHGAAIAHRARTLYFLDRIRCRCSRPVHRLCDTRVLAKCVVAGSVTQPRIRSPGKSLLARL